jgi:hypothetical protein
VNQRLQLLFGVVQMGFQRSLVVIEGAGEGANVFGLQIPFDLAGVEVDVERDGAGNTGLWFHGMNPASSAVLLEENADILAGLSGEGVRSSDKGVVDAQVVSGKIGVDPSFSSPRKGWSGVSATIELAGTTYLEEVAFR